MTSDWCRRWAEAARGAQVQVEMYPDRLLIRNPGGLYSPVEIGSLGTTTITSSRNRTLLKILEDTPYGDGHMVCESRGTGIARMIFALTEAGMEPPRFTDEIAIFAVEFPNHALLDEESLGWLTSLPAPPLSRSQMTGLVMMRNGGILTNSGYRASTGVQDSRIASRELKELVDAGLVEQTGTRGSTTYRLTSVARRDVAMSAEPTAAGTGLSANESRVLRLLAQGALGRPDLERATGMNRDQLRPILERLRQQGRIALLGKARARNVRWALTVPQEGSDRD